MQTQTRTEQKYIIYNFAAPLGSDDLESSKLCQRPIENLIKHVSDGSLYDPGI